jgi:hypothetical protein
MSEASDGQKQSARGGQRAGAKKIAIDVPKELRAIYSNIAFIGHTQDEFVVDFAQVLPSMPRGSIQARVVMSPSHAKKLQMALNQNLTNYERQFGPIQISQQSSIADKFFQFGQQDPGEES